MLASSAGMAQKMSPDTEILLFKHQQRAKTGDARQLKALSTMPGYGDDGLPSEIGAFITVSGGWVADKLREAGCEVNSVIDNIVTVNVPLDVLPEVAKMPGVEYIEAGNPVSLKNFNTRRRVKVNDVHNGVNDLPAAYRGKGVIIGMIDLGFQYNHAAFRSDDGNNTLRISRIWNQNLYGMPPEGFSYGAEYSTPSQIQSAAFDSRQDYHGTHTATTAAGSPKDNPFYGMAPESEIVLVSARLSTNTSIIDAIKYIFDYADSQNKPCVINMSLGSHMGPHDGQSAIDRAINSMVGPGKIVVGAAGNEAGVNIHCSKTLKTGDTTLKTLMAYPANGEKHTFTYIWGTPGTSFSVEVAIVDMTRKGRIVKSTGILTPSSETAYLALDEGSTTKLDLSVSPVITGEGNAPQFVLESECLSIASNRKQAIIVHGEEGQTIHMWNAANNNYFTSGNLAGFTEGDDLCTVGEIGGIGEGVISVGSYDTDSILVLNPFEAINNPQAGLAINSAASLREADIKFVTGARSSFSSRGPTADGRMKPEVMAPGSVIISGFNSFYSGGPSNLVQYITPVRESDQSYFFEISMGTSQATPVVTGTIALWLEANPDLTPEDIRGILSRTCDRDNFTGTTPNNDTGYGKLNAYAGIRDVLGLSAAIDDVTVSDSETKVWVDPATRQIYCVSPGAATASIYSVSGVKIGDYSISSDCRTIDGSDLPQGIYVVTVAGNNSAKSFKIRL